MVAGAFTTGFYLIAALIVWRRADASLSLLSLGTLPFVWISLCALAGLADTLLDLPPLSSLGAVLAALSGAAIVCVRAAPAPRPRLDTSPLAATALLIAVAVAIAVAIQAQRLEPWGSWDAMFTWVLRARFFFTGGDLWRNTFSEDLALLHPDYPPLLGWALHAVWRLDGVESSSAIAWLFLPSWPGLLLVMIGWWRARNPDERLRIILPLAVLLVTPLLWKLAASKLADFLLAYAIAASAAWYCCARRLDDPRGIAAAAFLAAWAGLVKNEGILWLLAFGIVVGAGIFRLQEGRSRQVRSAILGAALPCLALVLFKLFLAPPSDLVAPQRPFEVGEIIQPGMLISEAPLIVRIDQVFEGWRHTMIRHQVWNVLRNLSDWGLALWLVILLAVFQLRRPKRCSPLLIALFLQAGGYYAVYLITPYHPYWHLSTSMSRLTVHLLPAAIGLLSIEFASAQPENSPRPVSRWFAINACSAAAYLIVMPLFSLRALHAGDWQLGQQPRVNLRTTAEIELPRAPTASYVSSQLGAPDLYAAQFESVPTILLVDRRERLLLARFESEDELRAYCERNGWKLEQNNEGNGWARDTGGEGLPQPVTVDRIE